MVWPPDTFLDLDIHQAPSKSPLYTLQTLFSQTQYMVYGIRYAGFYQPQHFVLQVIILLISKTSLGTAKKLNNPLRGRGVDLPKLTQDYMGEGIQGLSPIVAYGRFFPTPTFFCCRICFADFAIAVIFYPVIKILWKNFAYYFGVATLRYQIWEQKSISQKCWKNSKNQVKPLVYWIFG